MRLVVLLCLLALSAAPALARPIYVDNMAGDDTFNGADATLTGGFNGPVRTINKALRLAAKGDRIVLANTGVPYRESISLCGGDHSGHPLGLFVIEGNGATLDGSVAIEPYAWEPVRGSDGLFRFRPARMAYQQLFLDGLPLVRVRPEPGQVARPALQPLEWCLFDRCIYFRAEPGKWIDVYALSHAGLTVGVTLYQVRHVAVTDLVVQGFQLDGVNAHDVQNCTLYAITARGNGRSGLAVAASSRVLIDGCLAGDNGAAQVWIEGESITTIRDSELLTNTAPDIVRHGGRVTVEPRVEGQPNEQAPPQDDVQQQ